VTWTSLESEEEQRIFLQRAAAGFFNAWHAARRREQRVYIVRDTYVMGGIATVAGTRIPAVTIAWCLAVGHNEPEIHADYPTLPIGAAHAVRKWVSAHDELEWDGAPRGFMRTLEAQAAAEVVKTPTRAIRSGKRA
jgi:uncharacterized protein (DUF433 family)